MTLGQGARQIATRANFQNSGTCKAWSTCSENSRGERRGLGAVSLHETATLDIKLYPCHRNPVRLRKLQSSKMRLGPENSHMPSLRASPRTLFTGSRQIRPGSAARTMRSSKDANSAAEFGPRDELTSASLPETASSTATGITRYLGKTVDCLRSVQLTGRSTANLAADSGVDRRHVEALANP